MMFRFPSVIRCTGFFCLAIIKDPPNDIYCIIEEPYKHYFTEKVSYSLILPKISFLPGLCGRFFIIETLLPEKSDSSLLRFLCFIKISGLFYMELIFFPNSFGGQTRADWAQVYGELSIMYEGRLPE